MTTAAVDRFNHVNEAERLRQTVYSFIYAVKKFDNGNSRNRKTGHGYSRSKTDGKACFVRISHSL